MWTGTGSGSYPTIEDFSYTEQIQIDHVGDRFLRWSQESWSAEDHEPLHFEQGFLRPGRDVRTVELTLAHPLGLVEVSEGTVEDGVMELDARPGAIGRTSTGMGVVAIRRVYRVKDDVLRYQMDMATENVDLTRHLEAELRRSTNEL